MAKKRVGRKKAPGKGRRGRMQSKKTSLSALSPGIRNSVLVSDVQKLDLTWALKVTTISDSNAKVKLGWHHPQFLKKISSLPLL